MADFHTIKGICFAGGGVRGISHIGVLDALQTSTSFSLSNVKMCTGTSIGALIALAVSLQYNMEEIKLIMGKLHFPKLLSMSFFNLSHWGLDSGANMRKFIQGFVHAKTNIMDPTFSQLYQTTGVHLQIIGANLTQNKEVCFSYQNTPDMPVCLATMISMSLPILFRPIQYKGDFYVDGSIMNNRPFQGKYYRPLGLAWQECIFLDLDWPHAKITSFTSYMSRIMNTLIRAQSAAQKYDSIKENIIVSIVPHYTVNFHLSDTAKQKIIQCGYLSVNYFIMRIRERQEHSE